METKLTNSKIYNVIILDKSGSMATIREAAIAGLNETIGTIKASQRENGAVEQFISVLLFCGCEKRYIIDKVPALEVGGLMLADYEPCCSTPLFDAIGKGILDVAPFYEADGHSAVSVTIITDGYENSSTEFTHQNVVSLIDKYKSKGWLFAYIGADHDVEQVAFSINIANTMRFDKNPNGVKQMFKKEAKARKRWAQEVCCCYSDAQLKELNENYFKKS